MKIYFDVYAITLTDTNITQIIEATTPLGWTLSYIKDNMEYNAEDGFETVLFMKLFKDSTDIATFAEESMEYQEGWKLTEEVDPKFGIFRKIEKI